MDIDIPCWDALDQFAIDLARSSKGRVWRTRLHPYTADRSDGTIEMGPAVDLDRPPDPWSQRLQLLHLRRTQRRLQRRAWFAIPDGPDWDVAAHPDSTTYDDFERLP